jgi:hypothetical protein
MTEGQLQKARIPPRWFIRSAWSIHRGLHRMTGGRFGLRPARPDRYGMMRLTVSGRRSGSPRSVILGYLEDGPNLVTMATPSLRGGSTCNRIRWQTSRSREANSWSRVGLRRERNVPVCGIGGVNSTPTWMRMPRCDHGRQQ